MALAFVGYPRTGSAQPGAQPETRPAGGLRAADPQVDRILDRLEAKGKTIKDISTPLTYAKKDPVFNSETRYEGTLLYKEDKPNPRFMIQFDYSVQDQQRVNKKEWHVFDGRWYIEAREKTKNIVKHEILRPGEQREVFRLGQGPFPVPFGQKKEDILKNFEVRLVPRAESDPPGIIHLESTPRPGTEMAKKYDKVHFYIDPKLDLPIRVQTVEKQDGNEIIATFRDPQINTGLAGSRLELPALPEYSVSEDRLPAEGQERPNPPAKSDHPRG
ncbi:MAG: hypothetical protein AMXMBFR13_15130 [Phycisphaerae bacterium]